MAKFVYFLEDVLPNDRVVRFLGIPSIARQLEQMVKSGLVEKKSSCYRITEKGLKFAEEAELSIEQDEEIDKIWHSTRDILAKLPVSRLRWDSYLDAAFDQLSETPAVSEVQ
jgi:DNA-binding PadR family transcriptional regulator